MLIEPVVELILKNTLSNDDVVVLIEPVTELILKLTKSCEPVCVLSAPVLKLIDAVELFIEPVTIEIPKNTLSKDDVVEIMLETIAAQNGGQIPQSGKGNQNGQGGYFVE